MNRQEFDARIEQICKTAPSPIDEDKTYFLLREHAQFDYIDSLEEENAKLKADLGKSEEQRKLLSELNKGQMVEMSGLTSEIVELKLEIEEMTKRSNSTKLHFDAIGMQLEDCIAMTERQELKIKDLEIVNTTFKGENIIDRDKAVQSMCHSWFGDGYEATEAKIKKHIFDQMGRMFDNDIVPLFGKYLIEESRCDHCARWDITAIGNPGYGMCNAMGRVTRGHEGCEFALKDGQ